MTQLSFTYFDFVELFEEKDRIKIDLYYTRVLGSSGTALSKHCHALKKKFSARHNKRARFGKEYLEYWDNLDTVLHENKLKKRARELEEEVQRRVIQKVKDSFDNSSSAVEDKEVEEETHWADKVKEILVKCQCSNVHFIRPRHSRFHN